MDEVRPPRAVCRVELPASAWLRRSAGAGSKGPRFSDWAWLDEVTTDADPDDGGHHDPRLAVGLIPTVAAVYIPGALRKFRQQYLNVHISLRAGASEELVEQVKQGAIEVAFLGLPTNARTQA